MQASEARMKLAAIKTETKKDQMITKTIIWAKTMWIVIKVVLYPFVQMESIVALWRGVTFVQRF